MLTIKLTVGIEAVPGWACGLLTRLMLDMCVKAFGGLDVEDGEAGRRCVGFCGTRHEWHGVGDY